jgi:hypothetical protein
MKTKTNIYFIASVAALFFLFCAACLTAPAPAAAEQNYNSIRWADVQRNPTLESRHSDGVFLLNNIRWGFENNDPQKPIWKKAVINIARVKNVYFFLKPFPPEWLVAHAFLLFEFEEDTPLLTTDGEKSRGLILSVEPAYRFGRSYGTPQTENPMYIVYQLSSREDYLQVCSIEKTRALFPFRLSFSKEQMTKLLSHTINTALGNITANNKYDLLKNNCINNLFVLFNSVMTNEKKIRKNFFKALANPRVSTPQLCVRTLRSLSLITQALPPVKNMGAPVKLTGIDLEKSMAKAKSLCGTIDRLSYTVLRAIDTQVMNKDIVKTILYNSDADYAVWMHVPGVIPGSRETGEFFIGEEFMASINAAKTDNELKTVLISAFKRFKAAVNLRMAYAGPDISVFISSNVNRIHDSVTKYVNAASFK